jgi:outer membrane lipoprotein-sorting protein
MRKLFQLCIVSAIAIGFAGTTLFAETWEEVAKKIGEKSKAITSMQYKTKTVQETKDPNYSSKSDTQGSFEYVNKDGKMYYRMDMVTKSETKFQGGETKNNMIMQTVGDGEFVYSLTEMDGNKQASKSKYETGKTPDMDQTKAFKEMEKMYSMKVLPDETVDGRPTFVVEMMPKDPQMKQHMGKSIYYYCKETGIALKALTYSPKGEVISTTTTSDIKVNPSIAPDRFKFTPPAGVVVTDNTKPTAPKG